MQATGSKPLSFCANLSFLYQEKASLFDRYQCAKKSGFKAVEGGDVYNYQVGDLVAAKKANGLEHILINLPMGGDNEVGVACDPRKAKTFGDHLSQAVTYAKALDCKLIHILAGKKKDDLTEKEMDDAYIAALKTSIPLLKDNGLVGVIEPINRYSVPGYYMNSYDRAVGILKTLASPHIKLMLDVFHLQQIQGNLTKSMTEYLPLVGHVQIAQVPNRFEPNSEGEINYKYVLSTLGKLNYDKWIGLEYKPATTTDSGLKWIHEFGYQL